MPAPTLGRRPPLWSAPATTPSTAPASPSTWCLFPIASYCSLSPRRGPPVTLLPPPPSSDQAVVGARDPPPPDPADQGGFDHIHDRSVTAFVCYASLPAGAAASCAKPPSHAGLRRRPATARNPARPMTSRRASEAAATVAGFTLRAHIASQPQLSPADNVWIPALV